MRKFIKLTSGSTGTAILLDVSIIRCILQSDNNGAKSKTCIVTDRADFYVKESYYTVLKRMEKVYDGCS